MFCPNCGTQNDSAATPCKKCGFKLSQVSTPKFKGTMVLNSDQTVQELIEEHRRKQAQGGAEGEDRRASEPPPPSSGALSALGAVPGSRGPVLQPPRAAVGSRRRMGGTMLGVAPQAGGVLPPQPPATRPAPAAPVRAETLELEPPPASAPADPLAGTAAMPAVEPAASPPPPAAAPVAAEPEAGVLDGAAPIDPGGAAGPGSAAEAPGAQRPLANTLPLQPEAAAGLDSRRPAPPRLRALDVVLIIVTFGLYGIVLWAKQRRPPA